MRSNSVFGDYKLCVIVASHMNYCIHKQLLITANNYYNEFSVQ